MLLTREQMMNMMKQPAIAVPKLDSTGSQQTVNNGQLLDKDKNVMDVNATIDSKNRFVMHKKHV